MSDDLETALEVAIKKLGDLLGLSGTGSQQGVGNLGDEEVAGVQTGGNDKAEGPQEAQQDRAGSDSIDHGKGEATGGDHAPDGEVVGGDLAGPQLSEDNDEARNPQGDEQ